MRAAVVLALMLGVLTPSGVWAGGEARLAADASAAMGSPAGALCQLVRDCAKAEKTFSGGWFAAADRAPSLLITAAAVEAIAPASPPHAVAIDSPPLAPRPPPLS
jgi:hypothetical protein